MNFTTEGQRHLGAALGSKNSSNINEVIKTVLNILLFFYGKISHAPKITKKQKALKSTKKYKKAQKA